MSTAFLGAMKDLNDSELKLALAAMQQASEKIAAIAELSDADTISLPNTASYSKRGFPWRA